MFVGLAHGLWTTHDQGTIDEMETPEAQDEQRNAEEPQEEQKRKQSMLYRRGPLVGQQSLSIVLGGYVVIALFAIAYGLLRLLWPSLSSVATVTVGAVLASPVVLGLLWPRLTGFKAFGFEVSLSQFTVAIDTQLAAAISSTQYFSGREHIVEQIEQAIARPEMELVEVNLHDGNYWAQTRLYVLSALADDFSNIRIFAFVEGGAKRTFVGFATPSAVRKALAVQFPYLEVAYLKIKQVHTRTPAGARASVIVSNWSAHSFDQNPFEEPQSGAQRQLAGEPNLRVKVNSDSLNDWLTRIGRGFVYQSVEWSGVVEPRLLRALVRDYAGAYVALLRGTSLDRVVNRLELAVRMAERAPS
jgi:hypothetical protein